MPISNLDGSSLYRGDGPPVRIRITRDSDDQTDFTGAAVRLVFSVDSPSGRVLAELSRANGGITIRSEVPGYIEAIATLPPSMTSALTGQKTLYFDIEVTPVGGNPTTRQGSFTVIPDIAR